MAGIVGGGASVSKSKSKTDVTIPEHLRPFIDQTVGASGGALSDLQAASGGDQFANLTPDQLAAMEAARGVATGAGGFIPTAQQTALDAAKGGGVGNFLSPEQIAQLSGGGGSTDVGGGIGDVSRNALEATARGDFLHGGDGFNAAVAAAQRAAAPSIMSTFGGAGAGGSSSGLAQTAIGTSAIDAFARQFGQERTNQLSAAGQLGGFGLEERGQDINARSGDLDRNQQGQGLLAGLASGERDRQLDQASRLPGLGLLESDILNRVGGQQQTQDQGEIDAPRQSMIELLQAALAGGDAFSDQFGEKSKGKKSSASVEFGLG